MKITLWDILAILILLGICGVALVFIQIFADPYSAVNPFKPPTMPAMIVLPSETATPKRLPPTWTPAVLPGQSTPRGLFATSTLPATSTGFVLPSFTPTPTFTSTPTNTPTVTKTVVPSKTPNKTATALAKFATNVAKSATSAAKTANAPTKTPTPTPQ